MNYKLKYIKYKSKYEKLKRALTGGQKGMSVKSISGIVDIIVQKEKDTKLGKTYERSFSSTKKRLSSENLLLDVSSSDTWQQLANKIAKKLKLDINKAQLNVLIFRKQFGKSQKGEDKKVFSQKSLKEKVDLSISKNYPYVTVVFKLSE